MTLSVLKGIHIVSHMAITSGIFISVVSSVLLQHVAICNEFIVTAHCNLQCVQVVYQSVLQNMLSCYIGFQLAVSFS